LISDQSEIKQAILDVQHLAQFAIVRHNHGTAIRCPDADASVAKQPRCAELVAFQVVVGFNYALCDSLAVVESQDTPKVDRFWGDARGRSEPGTRFMFCCASLTVTRGSSRPRTTSH